VAVDFKVQHQRSSEYLFAPEDIEIRPELNGRRDAPDISTLKKSIIEIGQLQPVIIRQDGGRPVLIAGFSRWRAISEINQERAGAELPLLKIRCTYLRCNEQEGYIANWLENRARNATSPLDDAHQFAQMERWGWDPAQIAERLGIEESLVKQRLVLIEATPEVQAAVSAGRMKPTAAAKIAKLSEQQQRDVVSRANGHGRITGRVIAEAAGAKRKPTAKELREYIEQTRDDTTQAKAVREFCEELLVRMAGE
jgi:ParB/RepB/Spo0J family partition protein